jgi:hypothetical protein
LEPATAETVYICIYKYIHYHILSYTIHNVIYLGLCGGGDVLETAESADGAANQGDSKGEKCVCVRARACARACVRACVYVQSW